MQALAWGYALPSTKGPTDILTAVGGFGALVGGLATLKNAPTKTILALSSAAGLIGTVALLDYSNKRTNNYISVFFGSRSSGAKPVMETTEAKETTEKKTSVNKQGTVTAEETGPSETTKVTETTTTKETKEHKESSWAKESTRAEGVVSTQKLTTTTTQPAENSEITTSREETKKSPAEQSSFGGCGPRAGVVCDVAVFQVIDPHDYWNTAMLLNAKTGQKFVGESSQKRGSTSSADSK
jgi:hypothetical protein